MIDRNGTYILKIADSYVASNKVAYSEGSPELTSCRNMAFIFDYKSAVKLMDQMDFVPKFIDVRGL